MERHIDHELRELKSKILLMGGYVEQAIEEATQALLHNKPERFALVFEMEHQINQAHMVVDEMCLKFLATQSPLAADLRFILAVVKINTDLERMGDQAVNIAHNAKHYLLETPIKALVDLPKMAREVQTMVKESLDAFVRGDSALARAVLKKDDEVDALKHQIFHDVKEVMMQDGKRIEGGLDLILIARNLERLGDHATNIAEDVIFVTTGDDIRHGGQGTKSPSPRS